jgi:hypothetical protein
MQKTQNKGSKCEPLALFALVETSTKVLPPYRGGILLRSKEEVQDFSDKFFTRSFWWFVGLNHALAPAVDTLVPGVRNSVESGSGDLGWIAEWAF